MVDSDWGYESYAPRARGRFVSEAVMNALALGQSLPSDNEAQSAVN